MELRLATFNLENLGIRAGEDTPKVRSWLGRHQAALRDTVRRLEADAVAFQEVLDPSLLEPLLDGLDYPHVVVGERAESPLLTGVFSRYPLLVPQDVARETDLALQDDKTGLVVGVRGPFSRSVLRVEWDAPGMPTTLLVVHWKSKIPSFTPSRQREGEPWRSLGDAGEGRLLTEVKRLAQAVALRREIDRRFARDPGARLAVLGDFNDILDSEALRIVRGDAQACLSPGLLPQELLPCELSVPAEKRYTQVYRGRPEMLDHIFISRALLPHFHGARVFNEFLRDAEEGPEAGRSADASSDHAPFAATFRV
ncbi:MAG: endonuclease/exonuclease/phosphatase family protein [Proteobacteria bacterium]|nr:endonuclease/exonuclease/phosphatase family protein [Pseudomonadota bacterium]